MSARKHIKHISGGLPQRTWQHVLHTKAILAVRQALPGNWFASEYDPDYGIDLLVAVVDHTDVTGTIIAVQVKSRKTAKKVSDIKLPGIRQEAIRYWHNFSARVMLVVFVEDENEVFWVWADKIPIPSPKSVTVCVPRSQILRNADWSKADLQKINLQHVTVGYLGELASSLDVVCPRAAQKIRAAQRAALVAALSNKDIRRDFFIRINETNPNETYGLSWETYEKEVRNWIAHKPPADGERYGAFIHAKLEKNLNHPPPTGKKKSH